MSKFNIGIAAMVSAKGSISEERCLVLGLGENEHLYVPTLVESFETVDELYVALHALVDNLIAPLRDHEIDEDSDIIDG